MTKNTADTEQRYSKAALNGSKRYRDRRDLITALLADDKEYTIEEADTLIEDYLNKEVK